MQGRCAKAHSTPNGRRTDQCAAATARTLYPSGKDLRFECFEMRDGEENAPVQVNPCRRLFLGFGLARDRVRGAITTCAVRSGGCSPIWSTTGSSPRHRCDRRLVARDISEHRSFSTRPQPSGCSPLPRPCRARAGQAALADAPADDQPLFCLRGGQPINPGTVSQTFHALVPTVTLADSAGHIGSALARSSSFLRRWHAHAVVPARPRSTGAAPCALDLHGSRRRQFHRRISDDDAGAT